MKKTLFKATNTHRANLHCHTTVSDGRKTPEETKEMYARQGYGIVAFTDHNKMVAHHELSDENFLAITALEVDRSGTGGKTYHINLYATREDMVDTPPLMRMDYSDKSAINAYLAERVAEGYLACYNHPSWSMQDFTDYANLENLWGMEIANFNCDTEGLYGISPQIYDEMLRNNGALFCVGTDDNHNAAPKDDSFGAWTVVNSPDLRYESVIKSLKDGDFYASTGPEIHEITIEDDIVTIKCSPCSVICLGSNTRKSYILYGHGLTQAQFKIAEHKYIRATVRDEQGDAWSNAYWLEWSN